MLKLLAYNGADRQMLFHIGNRAYVVMVVCGFGSGHFVYAWANQYIVGNRGFAKWLAAGSQADSV